jgi:hypothetical protein
MLKRLSQKRVWHLQPFEFIYKAGTGNYFSTGAAFHRELPGPKFSCAEGFLKQDII